MIRSSGERSASSSDGIETEPARPPFGSPSADDVDLIAREASRADVDRAEPVQCHLDRPLAAQPARWPVKSWRLARAASSGMIPSPLSVSGKGGSAAGRSPRCRRCRAARPSARRSRRDLQLRVCREAQRFADRPRLVGKGSLPTSVSRGGAGGRLQPSIVSIAPSHRARPGPTGRDPGRSMPR